MPEPNVYRYEDTGLDKLCDTKNAQIQETLVRSVFGHGNMTGREYWAKTVLRETFYNRDDEFDKDAWRMLSDDEQAFTVSCDHRGSGKTTRSGAVITHGICLRLVDFVLYLQATHDDAAIEMDNVKSELMTNAFIVEVFGRMKAASFDEVRKSFGKRAWYACNPDHPNIPKGKRGEPFCFVLPRGAGQRVRGRNIYIGGKRVRPRWVMADDLEDDIEVLLKQNRDRLKNWWFGAVMNCMPTDKFPEVNGRWIKPSNAGPLWKPPYKVHFNGTMLHHDALITKLLTADNWKKTKIPLGRVEERDDGTMRYISMRPSKITDAQLAAEAERSKKMGVLDTFYREKLCMPVARENLCWTRDSFKYITHEHDAAIQNHSEWIRLVIVDPSKSASQQADLTGIIAVALNPRMGEIVIRRAVAVHLNSNDIPDRTLKIAAETNSQIVFVEIIGQRGVTDINFTNAVTKRELPVALYWLDQGSTPHGDYGTGDDAIKRWRGQQILPYYQDGHVFHHPDLADPDNNKFGIESFLLDYPNPTDWCFIDTLGYISAAMHKLGVVFHKIDQFKNLVKFAKPANSAHVDKKMRERAWAAV